MATADASYVGDTVTEGDDIRSGHRIERLSHGIYGLIIATAALVAEQEHVDEAGEALVLLLGKALILFLAHTYSSFVPERVIEAQAHGVLGLGKIARNNLPLLLAIVVQAVFLSLAWLGAMSLQVACVASIAYTLMALFGLGGYAGRVASLKWPSSILRGIEAGLSASSSSRSKHSSTDGRRATSHPVTRQDGKSQSVGIGRVHDPRETDVTVIIAIGMLRDLHGAQDASAICEERSIHFSPAAG